MLELSLRGSIRRVPPLSYGRNDEEGSVAALSCLRSDSVVKAAESASIVQP